MLPDGTYCLAPPPPEIDASACYSPIPAVENMQSTTEAAMPSPPSTIIPPLNSADSTNSITTSLGAAR